MNQEVEEAERANKYTGQVQLGVSTGQTQLGVSTGQIQLGVSNPCQRICVDAPCETMIQSCPTVIDGKGRILTGRRCSIASFISPKSIHWMFFITNNTLLLSVITGILYFLYQLLKIKNILPARKMGTLKNVMHRLILVSAVSGILLGILFWACFLTVPTLLVPKEYLEGPNRLTAFTAFLTHGLPGILMAVLFLTEKGVEKIHDWDIFVYVAIETVLMTVYRLTHSKFRYPLLDKLSYFNFAAPFIVYYSGIYIARKLFLLNKILSK